MALRTHLKLFLLVFNFLCALTSDTNTNIVKVCEVCSCSEIKRFLQQNDEIILNIQCSELDRVESLPDLNKVFWPENPNKLKIVAAFEGLGMSSVGRLPPNAHVDSLSFNDNAIKSLWPNAFSDLPNLKKLSLSQNELEEITPDLFTNLGKLEELDLSDNKLSDFNKLDFASLKSLKILNLHGNLLAKVPLDVLNGIPSLEELDLSKNRIFSFKLTAGGKSVLRSLKRLNMNGNKLVDVLVEAFPENCSLESLDLSNNAITNIEEASFTQCNGLKELNLASNQIAKLFELPTKLHTVNLNQNQLQQWPTFPREIKSIDFSYNTLVDLFDEDYVDFDNLEILNLAGNKLQNFEITNKLPRLLSLDLSYNIIENIPKSIKSEILPALEELRLDGNPIEEIYFKNWIHLRVLYLNDMSLLNVINDGAFSMVIGRDDNVDGRNQTKCFHLLMSNCLNLREIKEGAFRNTSLCFLDISYNNLSRIPENLVDWKSLQDGVNLQANPWNCECSMQWLLDELLPQIYVSQPNFLHELRCESPRAYQGLRMVHWLNWGAKAFCSGQDDSSRRLEPYMLEPSTHQGYGLLKSTSSMTLVLVGCIAFATLIALSLTVYLIRSRQRSYQIRQAMLRKRQTDKDLIEGGNKEQFTALNRT